MVALTLLLGTAAGAHRATVPDDAPPIVLGDAPFESWGAVYDRAEGLAGAGQLDRAVVLLRSAIDACGPTHGYRGYFYTAAISYELRRNDWFAANELTSAALAEPHLRSNPTFSYSLLRYATEVAMLAGRLSIADERANDFEAAVSALQLEVDALARRLDADDPQLKDARASLTKKRNSARLTRINLLLAQVLPGEAVKRLEAWLAEDLASGRPATVFRADLYFNLGVAHAEIVTDDEADGGARDETRCFRLAIETCRAVGGMDRLIVRARLALARDALRHGELETARQFLDAVGDSAHGGVDRSLHAALEGQWARLAAPVDSTVRDRIDTELKDAYCEMIAGWRRAGVQRGGVGWLHFYRDRALVSEYIARVAERDGAAAALEAYAGLQVHSTLARRMNAPKPTLADIRSALVAPNHGVLVHVPSVFTGSLVFAVSQDTITLERVAPYHTVEPLRRAWTRRHAEAPGIDLAAHLLPPRIRAAMATWTRVTIVGLDGMSADQLPFDGAPLGSAFAVDHWPSLPVGVMAAARGDRHDGAAALIAPAGELIPRDVPQAPRKAMLVLPTGPAVEATARAIDGASRRIVTLHAIGSSATRDGLRTLAASPIDVLTFVGHAVTDWQRPEPALLVLADGCVDAESVREFDGAPRYVLMLGCRSGSERDLHGDPGATDLAGAWLEAGAGAVLATRTPISWHDGLELAASINAALHEGRSLAEAVRAMHDLRTPDGARRFAGVLEVVGAGQ